VAQEVIRKAVLMGMLLETTMTAFVEPMQRLACAIDQPSGHDICTREGDMKNGPLAAHRRTPRVLARLSDSCMFSNSSPHDMSLMLCFT
jgi:hypothetical protein